MSDLRGTGVMLGSIPFFQGLASGTLNALAPRFQLENLPRGEQLAGRGFQHLEQYQSRVYFLYQGVVSAYTITRQNTRKILFFWGNGTLLNHNVMGTKTNTLYVEAITDCILLSISREEFARLVQSSPSLTAALLRHYETDLWRMSHQLKNTAGYLSVERKLCIKLLKLSRDFSVPHPKGTAISFPLTITQTAEFLGLPRETTSRACKRLTEAGLLLYEDRHFILTDRERLRAYYREGQL